MLVHVRERRWGSRGSKGGGKGGGGLEVSVNKVLPRDNIGAEVGSWRLLTIQVTQAGQVGDGRVEGREGGRGGGSQSLYT